MSTVKRYVNREHIGAGVTFDRMGLYLKGQGLSAKTTFVLRPE